MKATLEKKLLKELPSVERIINTPKSNELVRQYGRNRVLMAFRHILAQIREEYLGETIAELPNKDKLSPWIIKKVEKYLDEKYSSSLKKAINATGVILHTGLGRAVLSDSAARSVNDIIQSYCTLAIDMETGRRGHRDCHLNDLICELTGAEAAVAVNNNAAATMLILNTFAKDREVILSRGQLVEIGGSFRIPDVMKTSGAALKEVGTTNKTHLKDYAEAICDNTAAIMRIHHSNYRILGFTSEPTVKELSQLAHEHGLCLIDDIGSGALIDLEQFGIQSEPLVGDSIKDGADVTCFSGDKLIGGPQAGIIVGKAEYIKKIGKNPLMRAFRVGKLTIAALEATLKLYFQPEKITSTHPVYKMFHAPLRQLSTRARKMLRALESHVGDTVTLEVVNGHSQVGSGSAPIETIPSKLLSIKSTAISSGTLAEKLRGGDPPIFPRVYREAVLLDFRTINKNEDKAVQDTLKNVLSKQD